MKTLKIKLLKVWPRPLHLMDYGLRKDERVLEQEKSICS